jgi:hypothetical protein
VIVEDVTAAGTDDGWRLSAAIRSESGFGPQRLYFGLSGGVAEWLPEYGDAFLAALLMPAMSLGEELVVDAPVSGRLLRSVRTVMEIYQAWWQLHPIPVAAARGPDRGRGGAAIGLFFTTGVDCFYSLLKDVDRRSEFDHQPVTDLLFVNFERQDGPDYQRLLNRVRHVAEQTGGRSVVVNTNVRALSDPLVGWEGYHGAALAAVALALQGLLGRCLIAASDQYRHLPPLGSHPVLDHLWSTEQLEFVHDGAEATRTDKVERQLVRSPLALANLGVCWQDRPGRNCGECEKCLRTMAALELANALKLCRTLPDTLDLDRLRSVPMWSADSRDAMRSMVLDARRRGRPDIAEAAEQALRRYAPDQPGPVQR